MKESTLNSLYKLFQSKGYNPVIGDIYKQQAKWLNWYRGEVNDFHYYQIKTVNGVSVDKHKASLNMAKKVCEDWAGLLFNERSELLAGNDQAQNTLDSVFYENNFTDELINFIELSVMYGTGAIIEYIAKGKTKIDFIYGDKIMVLGYENTTITDMAVVDEFQKGSDTYLHVTYHLYEDGIYRIQHEIYKYDKNGLGDQVSLEVLFDEVDIAAMYHLVVEEDGTEHTEYYIEYETQTPHYQIFKPALTNNFDVGSPMGISIIGNSISVLEGLDNKYHSFVEDDLNSRKKVFVNDAVTKEEKKKVSDGNGGYSISAVRYIDRDDTLFQAMSLGEEKPIQIYAPDYNAQPHIDGIQHDMNLLSAKVGLGTGYYSFDASGGMTATEVIHKNSDTWRNRQKHLNKLQWVLKRMMYSILYLEKEELGNYTGELDLEYQVVFDDSIVVDDEKRLEQMKVDAESNFVPKWRYVMERYKLNEQEAKAWVEEAEESQNSLGFASVFAQEEETEEDIDGEES